MSTPSLTSHFYSLTPDTILRAVEILGYRTTGKLMALNSLENRVYQVEIEIDEANIRSPYDSYVIAKFYRPSRWTREQIQEEHQFLQLLDQADIPVVPALCDDGGASLHLLPDINLMYSLTPKVGGRHTTELGREQQRIIGRTLARIHNVGLQISETTRLRLTPKTYGWDNLDYLCSSSLLPEDSREAFRSVVEPILRHTEAMYESVTLIRLQGDCHLGNVLWDGDSLTILDFDDMIFGPAVQDLWLVNPGRDEDSKRRLDELLEGYYELRTFDHSEIALIEPLRALRIIHFESWIAKRWEDPAFQRTFPHFGTPAYWRDELAALREIGEIIGMGR